MKICFIAPLQDYSGYATFSRIFLKTLDSCNFDLTARALKYDSLDNPDQYKEDERQTELLSRPLQDIQMVIQNTTPNIEAIPKLGLINGIYFFWESDRLPPAWIQKIQEFDFVLVPCTFNAQMLLNCGCTKPIIVCPPPCDADIYKIKRDPLPIPGAEGRTIFYNICQLSAKKGVDALIRAYYAAFADRPDEVLLVLKTYVSMSNRHNEIEIVKGFINQIRQGCRIPVQKYPPILPIMETMSDDDIARLHLASDCYVNASRGEGWAYPAFDAICHGKTLISNNKSAMADWVTPDIAMIYDSLITNVYNMQHPDPVLYTGVEQWFEPSTAQMAHLMRTFHLLKKGDKEGSLTDEGKAAWQKVLEMRENGRRLADKYDYRNVAPRIKPQLEAAYESYKLTGVVTFNTDNPSVKKIIST